jgi:hypothetical protein
VNLRILPAAEAEVNSATRFLNEQSPGLGIRFLADLAETFGAIVAEPLRFAKLETLPPREPYRRAHLHPDNALPTAPLPQIRPAIAPTMYGRIRSGR